MPLDSRVSPGDHHLASSPPFFGLKLPARVGARLKLMFSVRRALGASSQEVTASPRPQHQPKPLVICVFLINYCASAGDKQRAPFAQLRTCIGVWIVIYFKKNPVPETHKHHLLI